MRIIQFGDVTLPQFNGRQSFPVAFRSALVALQGGAFDQDGTATYLEAKIVKCSFWVSIDDGNPIDDTIEALYREGDEGVQQLIAERRDGTLVKADGKLLDAAVNEDARVYFADNIATQGEGYAAMNMTFEIEYPYWLDVDDGEFWKLNNGILLNDNETLNTLDNDVIESITATAHTFTITNAGTAAVYKGTITFDVAGGSVTDLRITNTTTGELIEYAGVLDDGVTLVYDLLPATVERDSVNAYNFIVVGSTQLDFMHLELGANSFQVDGDFSGATVTMTYSWIRHYIR